MSKRSILRLIGAVRLADDADCIGLPLFGYSGTNDNFIPVCDDDLNIASFAKFDEFEDYQLEYNLPQMSHRKDYEIGDPMPIPFWHQGELMTIMGDAERVFHPDLKMENLLGVFVGNQEREPTVIETLSKIIGDARSGRNREIRESRAQEALKSSFGDVFYDPPVHSRYWVARFAIASNQIGDGDHSYGAFGEALRQRGFDWLEAFLSKTDYQRLISVLGFNRPTAFTEREAVGILFLFLTMKINGQAVREIERWHSDPIIEEHFRHGTYYYYIERGWPKLPIKYTRFDDPLSGMKEIIYAANRTKTWASAEKISKVVFGNRDAPKEIIDIVDPLVAQLQHRFRTSMQNVSGFIRSRQSLADEVAEGREALIMHRTLQQMEGVLYGRDRLNREIVEGRYGVTASLLEAVRNKVL